MEKLPKQDAGKSGGGTTRENYNADEIAQQSAYDDSTQVAQQMRQGDQAKGDPNNLNETGVSKRQDKNQRDNKKG